MKMKCTKCDFATDDNDTLIYHLSVCRGKPLNSWQTFSAFGLEPINCKTSEILEVIEEEENG